MFGKFGMNLSRWRKALELAPHIDDLHAAFEERDKDGALSRHERDLLENALAFSATTADDVGMPRADIVGVPETATFEEVVKAFQDSYHSRMPVIGRDLDDVKGIVSLKDVMALVGKDEAFDMAKLIRPVNFVSESMTLQRVLVIMKRTRMPIVVVSDEFGGTSGLITLKDILEELLGDIEDEHEDGKSALVAMGTGRYRVQGDYALEDLDRQLGTALGDAFDDVETIAGAVMRQANTVPARGESFALASNVQATVLASNGRRVLGVELKIG
ncbi:MAG: CBS domain-containing protein [Alphaproteobacteria bacterium]|nr:MAG: CBS domain-containing protein [Alphaproteobacteria bacterium]